MDDDNKLSIDNVFEGNNRKSVYSKVSFVLSAAPIAILLIGFIFCLVVSGGRVSDNDRGAVWWLFIAMIWMLVPVAIITNILSVIFGVIGLKGKKTVFAWGGIIIVSLEVLVVLVLY